MKKTTRIHIAPASQRRMGATLQREIRELRTCLKLLPKLPIEVHEAGRTIFSDDQALTQWLCTPDPTLAGKRPLTLLATPRGTRRVLNLLTAAGHGVPQ